nr:epoxide hydrolase domain protein [Rhodococcus sp. JVH1]
MILTHGWRWTFWHWSKVIDPLTDPAVFGGDPARVDERGTTNSAADQGWRR